jgi:hypothetical protein
MSSSVTLGLGDINNPNGSYVKVGVDWALKWVGPARLGPLRPSRRPSLPGVGFRVF